MSNTNEEELEVVQDAVCTAAATNEETMVGESDEPTPWYRTTTFLGVALILLIVAIVVPIVVTQTGKSTPTSSPQLIACNFISIPDLDKCLKTTSVNYHTSVTEVNGPTIPPEIGSLTQLTKLTLSTQRLSGKIPDSISQLTGLTLLDLGGNEITGPIPSGIGNLFVLQSFDASSSKLDGIVPASVSSLISLTNLNISQTDLIGSIPSSLCDLRDITITVDCGDVSCSCCRSFEGSFCSSLTNR